MFLPVPIMLQRHSTSIYVHCYMGRYKAPKDIPLPLWTTVSRFSSLLRVFRVPVSKLALDQRSDRGGGLIWHKCVPVPKPHAGQSSLLLQLVNEEKQVRHLRTSSPNVACARTASTTVLAALSQCPITSSLQVAGFWPQWLALLVGIMRVPAEKKISTYFSPFSYTFHYPDPTGVWEITTTPLLGQLFLRYIFTRAHFSWSYTRSRNPSKDPAMGTLTLKCFPTTLYQIFSCPFLFWAPQPSLDPFPVSSYFLLWNHPLFYTPLPSGYANRSWCTIGVLIHLPVG